MFYGFEDDPDLIFADIHEDGRYLYPGTGAESETGGGRARGTKLNIPMQPGAGDVEFKRAWSRIESYVDHAKPEFILFQCGADSLEGGSGNDTLYANRADDPGATDDGADTLDGGDGEDVLHLAGGDTGTGGMGADSFLVHDPDDSGTGFEITDFDPAEDIVTVFYTPQIDPETDEPVDPVLELVTTPDETGATLLLNGVEIGLITGGQTLTVADIALIPA